MAFKITKETDRPAIKMANFRLPEPLIEELKSIAEKEEITVTELVKQMLQFCIEEYRERKTNKRS